MFKTLALVMSIGAFLALRALVKVLLLPFRALLGLRKGHVSLRKGHPAAT